MSAKINVIVALFVIAYLVDMAQSQDRSSFELAAKIRKAVEDRIKVDQIEATVGRKASIHSDRNPGWASRYDVEVDAKTSQVKSLRGARHIVMWGTTSDTKSIYVLGAMWDEQGAPFFFSGKAYPR